MHEAETKAGHIDPALKAAGWGVVEGSKILCEYPITPGRLESHGKRGKALTADHVRVYRNRKLAVDEAKAWDEELTEGGASTKNYAGKLAVRHACATNGQGIYAINMQTGQAGETPPTRRRTNSGPGPSPRRTPGATASPPSRSRTKMVRIPAAIARTSRLTAQQFMELLFGQLPDFFQSEAELRALWSAADTRAKLLQGLADKEFGHDKLVAMQQLIDAEQSDLFDVLAYGNRFDTSLNALTPSPHCHLVK